MPKLHCGCSFSNSEKPIPRPDLDTDLTKGQMESNVLDKKGHGIAPY